MPEGAAKRRMCYKDAMSTFDNSPHVLRPRQQRSRDALAKIVQAAEHILRTDGPDGFSIAEVARVSGLPVGNIYRRFRCKEDILLALKDDVTCRVERAVMEKVGDDFACVEDFVSDFVLAMVNTFAQDETIHRALFDWRVRTPAMERIGHAARRRVFLHYRDKMQEFFPAQDKKRAEIIITVSFNIIAYAVIGRAAAVDPLLSIKFYNGDAELASGIELYAASGHSAGLQFPRVNTARGWVVVASDVSHFYENMESGRPFTTAFHVGQMLEGIDRLFTLAPSRAHIVPGHDPEVMRRYPAPRPELEGIVVRLDVAPHQGSQP
jgi:AcrR family transcriptional regulator